MTGSLQIKNNKYDIVLNTCEKGKRKIKWINTDLPVKGNKTRAQKLLREALGLCWDCVNFEAETITIRRTVSRVTTIVAKDKTKNNASRRSFPMTPDVKELLLKVLDACLSGVLTGNYFSLKAKEKFQNLSVSELFLVRVRRFELPAS